MFVRLEKGSFVTFRIFVSALLYFNLTSLYLHIFIVHSRNSSIISGDIELNPRPMDRGK